MRKIIFILVFILITVTLLSQTDFVPQSYNPASIYLYSGTLAGVEQLKIKTYIWGQVKKPGLYIVPDNTDLLTLISSAGGPTENAKLSKVRIIRSTPEGEKVIWVNLKKYIETGDSNIIPVLQPGDTVVISGSTYYAFTKAVDWLAQIAIILSVYVAISNIK
ncbi:MAG: SLBB domain-containing protein [Candidatus Cloacimonetes bacterium]|nr:SLBB domain-containing protein [Candidatus Cloacimonadota bacterium]